MKTTAPFLAIAATHLLFTIACRSEQEHRPHAQQHEPALTQQHEPAAVTNDACQPIAELATLDRRTAVPLLPMMAWHQKQSMMEHLEVIQRITDALAREDWDEIARAAALIGSSPEMQRMCRHLGAGADGFTEMALDFHRRADEIDRAARQHDGIAVLRATSNTLQACTACHSSFRQEVVDATSWQARTGSAHDSKKVPGNPARWQ